MGGVYIRLLFDGRNRVTSGFRTSERPTHNGFDIVGDDSKLIRSITSGTVGFAGQVNDKVSGGHTWEWGIYVRVDGSDGYKYYYCHMESKSVVAGQRVNEGDVLGVMGNTGYSFGAHTHFEVRKNSEKINPSLVLGIPNKEGTYTMVDTSSEGIIYSGIDVSKYQGNIDWQAVKKSGQYFAFIRVGFCNSDGSITEQSGFDPYFHKNMENAIAAGMNVGVYVYSYANSEEGARNAADKVFNCISSYKLTMPVAFDFEDGNTYSKFTKQQNVNICKAFLSRMQQYGYYTMLYTYTNFANSYLDMSQLSAYDFWVADYRQTCGYNGDYSIWQYTSSGSVSGISGRVDMNKMYKDLPSIIRNAGLNRLDGGEEKPMELTNTYLQVNMVGNKNPNEYFNSMSVDDVAGRLDTGLYKVTTIYPSQSDGFNWAKIIVSRKEYYAVYDSGDGGLVNDKRAVLVEKAVDEPVTEPGAPKDDVSTGKPVIPSQPENPTGPITDVINDLIYRLTENIEYLTKENDYLREQNSIFSKTVEDYANKMNRVAKEAQEVLDAINV